MKSRHFPFLVIFIIILLIQSCSSTKYVPEGEYWLRNATVKSDNKRITAIEMEPYIYQKSNYKTFALMRLPLFLYNLSGSDTTKWINRVLRSGGELPVIYDSTKVEKTATDLTHVLANKGYVHAQVQPNIKMEKKTVDVEYVIKTGKPYHISQFTIDVSDSIFSNNLIFKNNAVSPQYMSDNSKLNIEKLLMSGTLVKSNSIFDLDVLDLERDRVASILRRLGYYQFDKEYIGFVADTTAGLNKVDLELVIYPYTEKLSTGNIIESSHRQYIVKEVDFYVDYNPLEDGDINKYMATDTVVRNNDNYKIYYGGRGNYIRPNVIIDNCYIAPGELYNESSTTLTYNSLSQLNILRNVNIRYEEIIENDSTKLKCIITCIPDKKQGISTEIEGTNSGGLFGVGASVGYLHRNIFKGSELFNAKVKGAYEAITPSFSSFNKNYFEIGGEMSLTFPRFMFPFLKKDVKKKLHASTQFTSNYIFQRRPEYFTRTILSSRMSYLWQSSKNNSIKHAFDLLDVSYIRIPELDSTFSSRLTDAARVYSFTDQFILSSGYTYTNSNYNPLNRQRLNSIYSIRASVETAGNVLSLISALTNGEKDEYGSRKIFGTRYAQYVLGNVDYSRTIPLDEKNSVAWRLGGGLVYPYGNNKLVPIQKRFFSGGANSVRGWAIRELGPGSFYRDNANFYDQSGDIRFDANVEYRSKVFWKLELAAFLDAGNIWTAKKYENQENGDFKLNSFYKEIAAAWGLGFRLDFDFVLIRLDCGWKLYDPAKVPLYKSLPDGSIEFNGYKSQWPVTQPFNFKHNTAWHIAVGYPF